MGSTLVGEDRDTRSRRRLPGRLLRQHAPQLLDRPAAVRRLVRRSRPGPFTATGTGRLIERHPAANVRRPKVGYESRTPGLDRDELGTFSRAGRLCFLPPIGRFAVFGLGLVREGDSNLWRASPGERSAREGAALTRARATASAFSTLASREQLGGR